MSSQKKVGGKILERFSIFTSLKITDTNQITSLSNDSDQRTQQCYLRICPGSDLISQVDLILTTNWNCEVKLETTLELGMDPEIWAVISDSRA